MSSFQFFFFLEMYPLWVVHGRVGPRVQTAVFTVSTLLPYMCVIPKYFYREMKTLKRGSVRTGTAQYSFLESI